jgi:hypothetical protein
MSIQEQLRAELKDAMRQRDQRRMNVVRQIETELSLAKSAKGFSGEVDDALYLKVIASYVKKMDKARKEYEGAGERGQEMVETLSFEIDYLARWLPRKLSEEETRTLVREAVAELGASDVKQAGRIVGHLMKQHKDSLDGALVNCVAREELQKDQKD